MRVLRQSSEPSPRRPGRFRALEDRVARFVLGAMLAVGLSWLLADVLINPTKRNIQVMAGVIFLGIMLVAQPYYGLLFAVVAIPFPASTTVGTTSSLLVFAMAGLTLVKAKQMTSRSPFFDRKVDLAFAAFIVWNLLALYPADFSAPQEIRLYYSGLLSSVVLYYLVLFLVQDRARFVTLLKFSQGMAILLGVIANVQALFPTKTILPAFFAFSRMVASREEVRAGTIRAFATFPGYELFAEFCAISIVLQYFVYRRARGLFEKSFWALGILVMAAALFRTGTRGGLIILAFAFVYALVVGARAIPRGQILRLGFVTIAMFYLTLPFTYSQVSLLLDRMANIGVEDSSVQSRTEVLAVVLEEIPKQPLLGHGVYQAPGTFRTAVDRNIHNLYLTLAYRIGIPGLIFWVLFVGFILAKSLSLARDRRLAPDMREYVLGFHIAVAMFALDQVKIEFVRSALTMHTTFLMLAMTMAICRIAADERDRRGAR